MSLLQRLFCCCFCWLVWVEQLSAKQISACGHPEYPPVSWLDNGELVGVAPSVARALFSKLGYQLAIDTSGNWERCLQEVKAGNIDIVLAAYQTQSRKQYLSYIPSYLIADPLSIFIHRQDNREYKTLAQLRNKRVGLLLGDSFGDRFDQFLASETQREYVSKGAQNYAKLAHRRIDFMPLGINSGELQLRKFGYRDLIRRTALTIGTEYYYLALGKHSDLQLHLPELEMHLKALRSRGEIDALQQCYSQYYLTSEKREQCDAQR